MNLRRTATLKVEAIDGSIVTMAYPLSIEFSVERNILGSANQGKFKVYNLSAETRKKIFKAYCDYNVRRTVEFYAGFEGQESLLFKGTIMQATNGRDGGSTENLTEIEALDYGYVMSNTTSSVQMQVATAKQVVVNKLVSDLVSAGLKKGVITNIEGTHPRGYVGTGSTWTQLQTETDNACFIDNGFVHVLKDKDVFEGALTEISSATGLLGAPKMDGQVISAEVLFEPRFLIGQQIKLTSTVSPEYNGDYKLQGINHNGMISGAVGGLCRTTAFMCVGDKLWNTLYFPSAQ